MATSAGNKAVAYHIMDTSSIAKVSMKNLLARVKTKDDMTAYLAEKKSFSMVLQEKKKKKKKTLGRRS